MTPKEKAVDIICKCLKIVGPWSQKMIQKALSVPVQGDEFAGLKCLKRHDAAKKCALILVREILSMGIMSDSGDWKMAKSYWEEVQQEIENL